MVNALKIVPEALPPLSLPPRVAALVRMLGGAVDHPGLPTRYHIDPPLTPEDRAEAQSRLSTLTSVLSPEAPFGGVRGPDAKLGIVTTLLTGLAKGNAQDGIDSKFDLYELALDDVPAWAVAAAARRWVKRDCPAKVDARPNYAFPPDPSVLWAIAREECSFFQRQAESLRHLLAAVTLARAMDPTPMEHENAPPALAAGIVPLLKKM